MVRRIASSLMVVAAAALMAGTGALGCTVFSYAAEGVVLFGSNEDYDLLEPYIWFLEPGGTYHGALCLGFDQWALQGGMNDVGLCYDATGSTSTLLNWHKEKPDAPTNWPSLALQQCATVDEVEAFVRRYDFSSKGMAQYLWLDRNGDSLVITSSSEGEVVFLRQSGGYRVITNFNVTDPSYGFYPCWRYDTAELMLRRFEDGSSTPSVATFRSILNGTHQPGYTAYSNVFDLTTLTAYVYRNHDFRDVRVIELAEVLSEGPPQRMTLDAYFEATASD